LREGGVAKMGEEERQEKNMEGSGKEGW